MLKYLNPSMQALCGVVRQNSDLSLCKDLPVIDPFVDVVHRAAGHCFARDESLFPRFKSWEFRQKRWVNVDNATRERLQHWFMQDAHETGENDKFDTSIAQHLYELLFYFRLQTRAKSTRRQIRIRDTKLRAISRIGASRTSETTKRASAARSPDRMRSRIARQLLPFPDPRIPIGRRFI